MDQCYHCFSSMAFVRVEMRFSKIHIILWKCIIIGLVGPY